MDVTAAELQEHIEWYGSVVAALDADKVQAHDIVSTRLASWWYTLKNAYVTDNEITAFELALAEEADIETANKAARDSR